MKIVVNVELIEQKYLAFKEKEQTELAKAEEVAKEMAQKLQWNEVATQQMVDYVVATANAQLATEKAYWEEIVSEVEEEPEQPAEEEIEDDFDDLSETL